MARSMLEMLFSLENKTALITGGYQGIGRLFADTYAEAGANVVIAARNLEACTSCAKEIEDRHGVKAIGTRMDVNDARTVDLGIEKALGSFGRIDILVNSAGISGSQKPVVDMTEAAMDEVMNVDFRGTFLVSRAVSREMIKHKSGKIINIASILGRVAARYMAGYCSSKAAVVAFTKVLALELLRYNIQVNVLCPGYFMTEFNRDFLATEAGKGMIEKMVPLGRAGNLEELRSTALYLASCPPYLTGSEICIDGGHTVQ
jgi:NAD(P)-dependent dehydrogenase (short-subunit alcohol dehydrogenase family)